MKVIADYVTIEMDHANRLSALGVKYYKGKLPTTTTTITTRAELPVAMIATTAEYNNSNQTNNSVISQRNKVSDDRPAETMSTPSRQTSAPRPISNRFFSSIGSSLMMSGSKAIKQSFQGHHTSTTHQDSSYSEVLHSAATSFTSGHSTNIIPSTASIDSNRTASSSVNDTSSKRINPYVHTSSSHPNHSDNISTSHDQSVKDEKQSRVSAVKSNETTTMASTAPLSTTRMFFDQISAVSNKMAEQIKLFASSLRRNSESDDLQSLVQQIHVVVVEAKANLQRNR